MKSSLKKYINMENAYIFLVLIVFSFLVFFKINGSSISMYSRYLYGDSSEDSILFKSRPIRSDEWLVGTPLTISQSLDINSIDLKSQGFGSKNIATIPVPATNFKAIFHPKTWGFFFMNTESAFSFYWWANDVILLIFLYLFLMKITGKNILISITFSITMLLSPFLQWWRGAAISTPAYGFAILYLLMIAIEQIDTKKIFFTSLLLSYFTGCYIFILYPPFQIAFAFFMMFFSIGYVLKNKRKIIRKKVLNLLIPLISLITLISLVLFLYIRDFRDVISIVRNTSYPGNRLIEHGKYSVIQLFNGFYNLQFLDEFKGSASFGNQSEGSSFFMISLLITPLLFLNSLTSILNKKKLDSIQISLLVFLISMLIVIFTPLPQFIYKITLLNFTSDNRIILGIGSASLILSAYLLSQRKISINFHSMTSLFSAVGVFLINIYIGISLKNNYPLFIKNDLKIISISLIAGLLTFLIIQKKQKLFCVFFLITTLITSYRINPLRIGLDPLINTPLAIEAKNIKQNNLESRWVVYDNIILSNYLIANGINTISGTFIYPQIELMRKIDQDELYKNTWNRYAHVVFNGNDKIEKPSFILNQADSFSISINPCDPLFKNLNVKYFVFPYSTNKYPCLELVKEFSNQTQNITIYKN